jgi:hypothetical protein
VSGKTSQTFGKKVDTDFSDADDENLDTEEFASRNDKSFNMIGMNYNSIDKRGGGTISQDTSF